MKERKENILQVFMDKEGSLFSYCTLVSIKYSHNWPLFFMNKKNRRWDIRHFGQRRYLVSTLLFNGRYVLWLQGLRIACILAMRRKTFLIFILCVYICIWVFFFYIFFYRLFLTTIQPFKHKSSNHSKWSREQKTMANQSWVSKLLFFVVISN